ncbi:MAG TPA: hypothetical protein VFX15_12360, partial [Actinomycetes bacterium]|nr:hypothetical protein [Actinomycetes bacterium]
LGTIIGDLDATKSTWAFAIPGKTGSEIDPVISALRTLWDGQSSRHGGVTPTRQEDAEQATAALHLAATLCQWFLSGAVRRP